MPQEKKKTREILKSGEVFSILEGMNDAKVKAIYGEVLTFGPQWEGQETCNRWLNLVAYELNRRENQKAFKQMRFLTVVAVFLAILQTAMSFFGKK